MSIPDLFTLFALICWGAACVVAGVQKSWVASLFCAGAFFIVLASANFITS